MAFTSQQDSAHKDKFGSLNDMKSHEHKLLLKGIVCLINVIVHREVFLVVDPYLLQVLRSATKSIYSLGGLSTLTHYMDSSMGIVASLVVVLQVN